MSNPNDLRIGDRFRIGSRRAVCVLQGYRGDWLIYGLPDGGGHAVYVGKRATTRVSVETGKRVRVEPAKITICRGQQ